jgi:hypothetical protein
LLTDVGDKECLVKKKAWEKKPKKQSQDESGEWKANIETHGQPFLLDCVFTSLST